MKQLYQARDSFEAQLLKDRLQAQHITAVVLGDGLTGAAGELSAMVFPTVWVVEADDLAPAKRVLAEFLAQVPEVEDTQAWICSSCGERVDAEFALCWQCGAARPA